jgi:hypothetical protein
LPYQCHRREPFARFTGNFKLFPRQETRWRLSCGPQNRKELIMAIRRWIRTSAVLKFLAGVAAACAAAASMAAPSALELKRILLSEPLWIVQPQDGRPTQVWFALEQEKVVLISCDRPVGCTLPVSLEAGGFAVLGRDGARTFWLMHESGPEFRTAGDAAQLVPAWVVPTAGARTGH